MYRWIRAVSTPILVTTAIVGLMLSWLTWRTLDAQEAAAAALRFNLAVTDSIDSVASAMAKYEQLVVAGTGFFSASDKVTAAEWRTFALSMQLDSAYPGALGLGFGRMIEHDALDAYIAEARSEHGAGFSVRPREQRAIYVPINFLEPPTASNVAAIGFDLYSEPVRREAMEHAVEAGAPALSGKVVLVQDASTPRPGTLLFAPVFSATTPIHTAEERRLALRGFVYVPFRMADLMNAVLGDHAGDMVVELYDGSTIDESSLLFERRRSVLQRLPNYSPSHIATREIEIAQRHWTLRFTTLPAFDAAGPGRQSIYAGAVGTILTLLLCITMAALIGMRHRAQHLAERMARAHQDSEARMHAVIEASAEGILTCDTSSDCRVLSANKAMGEMVGEAPSALTGRSLSDLFSSATGEHLYRQISGIRYGDRDLLRCDVITQDTRGQTLTVELAITRVKDESGGERLIVMASDHTAQVRAEALLRQSADFNRAILECAPVCVITTDESGVIQSINPAGERLLGYSADELVGLCTPMKIHLSSEVEHCAAALSERLGRPVEGFEVFVAGNRTGEPNESEWTYIRKDGHHVPVHLSVVALRDGDGRVTGFLGIAIDITERRRAEHAMRKMALHDALTGLPNRTLLSERFGQASSRARRNGRRVAVLLFDIDHFKQINDSCGHATGDEILQIFASCLVKCVRDADTVARTGGDEFVVLLEDVETPETACRVAAKINQQVREQPLVAGVPGPITTSIGIALFPDHGENLKTLLQRADEAMYETKRAGRDGFYLTQ